MSFTDLQIRDADRRLITNPNLPQIALANIRQSVVRARVGEFGRDHSVEMGQVLATARHETGGRQLLTLEDAERRFAALLAAQQAHAAAQYAARRAAVDQARHEEIAKAFKIERANKMAAPTRKAMTLLRTRLDNANIRFNSIESESDLREVLGDLGDAARSMLTSLDLEAKASLDRQAPDTKKAA